MNKSIVCVNSSESITDIDLSRFIYPEHVDCLILNETDKKIGEK